MKLPGGQNPLLSNKDTCHTFTSAVGKNWGGFRFFVACSNAKASLMSFASLHALPKNDTPTGNQKTKPAGTVMLG